MKRAIGIGAATGLVLLGLAAAVRPESPKGNVRDWGAVGDGRTDDTDAVERAIRGSDDGAVEFSRGTYRITRTIVVALSAQKGSVALIGRGGVARVVMAGAGPAFRFVGTHEGTADPESMKPGVWTSERSPRVEGLEIVGDHPEADGVAFVKTMQPTLSRASIRKVRNAVILSVRNRNLLVDSCHIYDCAGAGILFDRVNLHQAIIHGSHISYCKRGGIKVLDGEIRNLQIVGNDIEYNYDVKASRSADVWIDVTNGSVREGTISGNTIQAKVSPGGANLRFSGPSDVDKVSMFAVTGNHIGNQEVNIHLKNARGIVVEGNSIALSTKRNILIEKSRHIVIGPQSIDHNPDYVQPVVDGITVSDSDGCLLNGLLIEGAKAGTEKEGGAIELINCRETSVTSCQILDPKWRGVYVSGGRNVVVAGSTIVDRVGNPTFRAAVEVVGNSPGSVVRDNLAAQGASGSVVVSAGVASVGNRPAAKE